MCIMFTDIFFEFSLYSTIFSQIYIQNVQALSDWSWSWTNPLQVVSFSADTTILTVYLDSSPNSTLAFLAFLDANFATASSWMCNGTENYSAEMYPVDTELVNSNSISPPANPVIVSSFPNDEWLKITDENIIMAVCEKDLHLGEHSAL